MPKLSLYDYQQDALAHLLTGKKMLILETGLGKTSVAMRYAEEMWTDRQKQDISGRPSQQDQSEKPRGR